MSSLAQRLKEMTPLQRAVYALQETQARLEALERKRDEPLAIVGMSCRFPAGANDPESFWRVLCQGVDAVTEVPPERWDADQYFDADPQAPGKTNSRWGAFLERIDEFDNQFFGLSDLVAERTDPQYRILMELAWEALEDAGLPPRSLQGTRVGVFVGICVSEYGVLLSANLEHSNPHVSAGASLCMGANRVSFALGLQGPSLAVDTACSSSLTALHLACQSVRNGECEAALVSGTNLVISPVSSVNLTKAGFSAVDGRVRSFDASATGYVRSDGAGILVIKPLSAAQKNGDRIYAVVRGSAVNHNGPGNGVTAPSRDAQEKLLREVYARAKIAPEQVGYVEAHATGTQIGDAIEATALANVLGAGRSASHPCYLGSLKTNFGHMEAASGVAALIKTALVLQQGQVPPNLHFQTPNPAIPFDQLSLAVPQRLEPWPTATHPRYAGVSAFGFGGANAHVILEEPPAETPPATTDGPSDARQLLVISARTEPALHDLIARYRDFLRQDGSNWADICHTAAVRREHHDCRIALLGTREAVRDQLATLAVPVQGSDDLFVGRRPYGRSAKVAFLFGNDTDVWRNIAPGWTTALPGFAAATKDLDAAVQRELGSPLVKLLQQPDEWNGAALVAAQLALTAWWKSVGIAPDLVVGCGMGKLAAGVVAGVLGADAALHRAAHGTNGAEPAQQAARLPCFTVHAGNVVRFEGNPRVGSSSERFDALRIAAALQKQGVDAALEIGPADPGRTAGRPAMPVIASLRPARCGADVHAAVGQLYVAGADPIWGRLLAAGRCIRLPTYPWQRKRLWDLGETRLVRLPPSLPQALPAQDAEPQSGRARPDLAVPLVEPETPLEIELAAKWKVALGLAEVGVHDNFFELGGDSLQAMTLLNRLEELLGESLNGHVLFEVQTIHDLAQHLRTQYPQTIRRLYPQEPEVAEPDAVGAAGVPESISPIPRLDWHRDAESLLARLDDMDDAEVEALLQSAAEGELGP